MEELGEELANLPETLKHKLTIALRAPKFERLRFYAKIAKNYPELFLALSEPRNSHGEYGSYWKVDHQPQEWVVRTRILDILLLLQEEKRLKSETVK